MPTYTVVSETDQPIEVLGGEADQITLEAVDPIHIKLRHTDLGLWDLETGGVTDEQAQAIEDITGVGRGFEFKLPGVCSRFWINTEYPRDDWLYKCDRK